MTLTRQIHRDGWGLTHTEALGIIASLLLSAALFLTVPAAAIAPMAVVAAIFGFQAPKLFLAISLVAILFANSIELWIGTAGGYVDELMPIAAMFFAVVQRLRSGAMLRGFPGLVPFAVFVVAGISSALVQGVGPEIWSLQLLLALKGMMIALAVAQFDWTDKDLPIVARGAAILTGVLIAAGVAQLVIGDYWNQLIHLPPLTYRYGFPAATGLFRHPSEYAIVMAALGLAISSYRVAVHKSAVSMILLIGSVIGSVLTWRRKSLVGVLGALTIVQVRARSVAPLAGVLVIVPLVLIGIWSELTSAVDETVTEYIINGSVSARSVITKGAFDVASLYFPFGAGFGRYGSYVAAENYSPEYSDRGFQTI